MLNFEVNYTGKKKVEDALSELSKAFSGAVPKSMLNKVGNLYLADTVKRFDNQHDPDRKPWKPLRPITVQYKTTGMKGRGASIAEPTRRGVWTGDLINSLTFRVEGNSVFVGSNEEHAKYFHYGAKKLKKLGGNRTAPWGPVPSRRFLGRNTRIDSQVLKILKEEIAKLANVGQ